VDITARKQAEEEIRKQASRAEALLHTAARLNAHLDLDTLLETICQEAAAALHAPAAWINLLDAERNVLAYAGDHGMPPEFKDRYRAVPRANYEAFTAKSGHPITIIPDQQKQTNLHNWDVYTLLDIRSVVIGSMVHSEQLIGTISVVSLGEVRSFSKDELNSLQGLTDQAALAIVNTRLFAQVSEAQQRLGELSRALIDVQEAERRGLALELHDELGQILSAAKLTLDMIPTLPPAAAGEQLQRASMLVGDLVMRARRMALDLRPSMLDDMGLLPTLDWLFGSYQTQSKETVHFEQHGMERRFPPQVEITAYRIIQEALTNVMRHAVNRQVAVNVWADEQFLNLQIQDFGVGFDPVEALSRGVSSGLSGMRERARLLGGEMMIESRPGAGACLTARLPVTLVQESK
jgi:signal transduction histidine kinase